MTLAEAVQFLDKYVRTENHARHNCGRLKSRGFEGCEGFCGPDDSFGGEGLVVEVWTDDRGLWIAVDYGFAWLIDENTTVTIVDRSRDGNGSDL